ncbi:MAG: lecithin retinol acyltransferase family protein [Xenococcaceae cyanobacterium MO_188.B32]|nr:lecithin retinol acyltransferase family protein [Xenococcaceae cyanobacterium MO_188.B32]
MARGDQLYVDREFLKQNGVYKHHGIDCGDGRVIHYRKPSEIVERTSLAIFSRGNPVYIVEYLQGFCFIPEVVVERAESRLGEDKYNLLFNNCEHFATWCKTGISESKQIREFIPAISRLNTSNLYEPIKQALQGKDRNNAEKLINEALSDIKFVWNQVQPDYQKALQEMETWDKVAQEAVRRNRDDLARAALAKKWNFRQKATKLEAELDELAEMTKNLLHNLQDLG